MINIRVIPTGTPLIQVRLDGRSYFIPTTDVNINTRADDQAIRQAMAAYFGVPPDRFACYVVERYVNGSMTVRPEVVFG